MAVYTTAGGSKTINPAHAAAATGNPAAIKSTAKATPQQKFFDNLFTQFNQSMGAGGGGIPSIMSQFGLVSPGAQAATNQYTQNALADPTAGLNETFSRSRAVMDSGIRDAIYNTQNQLGDNADTPGGAALQGQIRAGAAGTAGGMYADIESRARESQMGHLATASQMGQDQGRTQLQALLSIMGLGDNRRSLDLQEQGMNQNYNLSAAQLAAQQAPVATGPNATPQYVAAINQILSGLGMQPFQPAQVSGGHSNYTAPFHP